MKSIAILLSLSLLAGCASMEPPAAPPPLLADARFAPPTEKVGADDLFTLSPAMRSYMNSFAFTSQLRQNGQRHGLLKALYSKTDLKLEYESSRTRTAAETYADRAGNCLSLVIMTAAFARELGMQVHYRSVQTDDGWSRSNGLYLTSAHVNIGIANRPEVGMRSTDMDAMLVVDFIPSSDAARLRAQELEEEDIVALYLNNRAAEMLVQGRIDDAYWWARAAVAKRPGMVAALNTLGVVYERHGDIGLAEKTYRVALDREPENMAVMRNLQGVLATVGKPDEAQALARRIASIEPFPPYYHFDKGMEALKAGDFDTARGLFAREVKRAPYNDEFRFWLGVAHLRLGDVNHAREQIARAVDTSTRQDMRKLYSAKLNYLRAQAGTGTRIR
ncbi:tetratricopeptide repeat protein [Massilia yuzhufengensis]|uniref:Tetratricopeptide repeat-containing protein n=1 Tax=Massilia yuzhufengensis TaxID=1164594 RepID=A0A1I1Q2Q7_9BURK|nr:tetratricopeptide repeat protein [Massilia yuzhufengensis]SFD16434.1 Tetratricopeptide repeat-containing protein [Massilia yuzhufengensis]